MPIYEYRCDACGFQKDYLMKMSDAPLTTCPECSKQTFSKMLTAAGFQLKGSGWYATDFKGGANRQIRNWIYIDDHCSGILHALKKGKSGEIYNISSHTELENIKLTKLLLKTLGKSESLIERVTDRLGHDRRYAISSAKLRALGWKETHLFHEAIKSTVFWNRGHEAWLKAKAHGKKS